jgi:Flp pilus assembly protein TadG
MRYRATSRSPGRAPRGNEQGAVLVEAALILPVLLLLLFGILEWGMAFKNAMSVTSATRAGARAGVAMPRNTDYDDAIVSAVQTSVKALSSADIQELWIYKAGTNGKPAGYSDFSGCSSTECYRYTWNGSAFVAVAGYSWIGSTQNACGGEADELGVYLKVRHHFITGMFGSDRTLTDSTVMRLEPIPESQQCKPAGA